MTLTLVLVGYTKDKAQIQYYWFPVQRVDESLCLMPLSKNFQLYRGGQFYWWRILVYSEKTTDLQQTLSHNVVSSTLRLNGIRTHSVSGDRH